MLYPKYLNIAKLFLPKMIWKMNCSDGVYITIDDGPTPGITEWILDELDKRKAKATFFCLGKNIELYPELFDRIVAAGHKVGNHTYNHLSGWNVTPEEYIKDVSSADSIVNSDIYRPPYGRITRLQAKLLSEKYNLIMGGVVSRDYCQNINPDKCLRNVINNVSAGSIIVFHDSLKSHKNMKYAFPRALDHIQSIGLEFKTLDFEDTKQYASYGVKI